MPRSLFFLLCPLYLIFIIKDAVSRMAKRPGYTFLSMFSPADPNVFVGSGSRDGVILYDIRNLKRWFKGILHSTYSLCAYLITIYNDLLYQFSLFKSWRNGNLECPVQLRWYSLALLWKESVATGFLRTHDSSAAATDQRWQDSTHCTQFSLIKTLVALLVAFLACKTNW